MMRLKKKVNKEMNVDFVEEVKKPLFNAKSFASSYLNRDAVLRQFPFLLFLVMLAIINIWNGYNTKRILRQTKKIENELKQLRSEQIAVSSELMIKSRQSSIVDIVNEFELGLKELTVPPSKIIINENE